MDNISLKLRTNSLQRKLTVSTRLRGTEILSPSTLLQELSFKPNLILPSKRQSPLTKSFLRLTNSSLYFTCIHHLCLMLSLSLFPHSRWLYFRNILGEAQPFWSTLLCIYFPSRSHSPTTSFKQKNTFRHFFSNITNRCHSFSVTVSHTHIRRVERNFWQVT